jgi:hypothetical protein
LGALGARHRAFGAALLPLYQRRQVYDFERYWEAAAVRFFKMFMLSILIKDK